MVRFLMEPKHRPRRLRDVKSLPLVVATVALAACGTETGERGTASSQADLSTSRTYVATSVPWREGEAPIETVNVRIGDSRVSLSAGCNELSTYNATIKDGMLQSESAVGTDMGCPQPRADQDAWLGRLLASTPAITITSDRFELRSKDAELVAAASP